MLSLLFLRLWLLGFALASSQRLPHLGGDDSRSVCETGKRGGCTVSTMDLSEARGLELFRVKPFGSMAGVVDIPSRARNRPAAIPRFQPIHDSRQIFDQGQIGCSFRRL